MKLVLCNDSHFGARQDSLPVNDYFFKFWDNIFFPYLEKHNIKTVVHLGDMVDRRKFISYVILNTVRTKFIKRLKDMGIDFHVLVGNHDIPYKNTNEVNAIEELFSEHGNIKVYTSAQDVEFDGIKIAMVPWVHNYNLDETLDYVRTTKADILFGHLEISGFEMDKGNVCQEGLNRDIFKKFDIVLSGHFHHKSTDGQIYYLGNQYQITWADADDTRGFHVFDTETRKLEFIENPYSLFKKITYDDKNEFTFEYLKTMDLTEYEGTYIKIIVVNKINPYLFETFIEELQKVKPLDISIVEDLTTDTTVEDEDGITGTEDTLEILHKYIDGLKFDGDKKILYNKLHSLYVEALSMDQM